MPKVRVTAVGRLTRAEKERLRELTLGPVRGLMQRDFAEACRIYPKDAKAVRLYDDEGVVRSWGLLRPHFMGRTDFEVFTEPTHRKKGYGFLVYQKARQLAGGYGNIVVHPWDKRSIEFFDKVHYYSAKDY